MYLQQLIDYNPALLEVAITLHQNGRIPPNTWVIDLDTVVKNGTALAGEAQRLGLSTYLMSKQHNRNPYVNHLALAAGLDKLVVVDGAGALMARRYNMPLGHAGHLNQIPRHWIPMVVEQRPEVITIYNFEHGMWIDEIAGRLGVVQNLLIRVRADGDLFYPGQEGGIHERELAQIAMELGRLSNVRLVGVTSFPCLTYNETVDQPIEITPNFDTIIRAARTLENLGVEITQINAPGNTSCHVMEQLQQAGATHVEPGSALLGTTPSHAFSDQLAERLAHLYLTEISHEVDRRAYAYGGGVFHNAYTDRIEALVGATWPQAKNNRVSYDYKIDQLIDYHMQLCPTSGQRSKVGDTVLLAYRTQMQMTRSYIAPVSGISGERPLKVHYLFDNANTALDRNYAPVDPKTVLLDIAALMDEYGLTMTNTHV